MSARQVVSHWRCVYQFVPRENPVGPLRRVIEGAPAPVPPQRGDEPRASQAGVSLDDPPRVSRGFPVGLGLRFFGAGRQRGYARGTVSRGWTRRSSPLLQVCGVPTPLSPWPGLSGACSEGKPFCASTEKGPEPPPKFLKSRDPPAAATRNPGPSDLGCPGGWASALPAAPQVSATFHGTSFSGVAVKFTAGVLAGKQKLTPSQTFLPFGPS